MTVTHQLADGGVVVRDTVPSSDVVRMRFGDVDGLKAFAALAVVAYQTIRFTGLPAGAPPALARLFDDASQGLTLFLVLSAFALAYPALAAMRADGAAYLDVGRYAVKRLLRIYPAFLVVLAFAAGLHPLAVIFRLPALANGAPSFDAASFARAAVFAGDGFGNDGFRALSLIARAYLVFPLLLALWARLPRLVLAVALAAGALDVSTPAHAWGIGLLVPLVLGIAAADLRVQRARFARFGLPLAAAAAAAAWLAEPRIAQLAGALAAPGTLRVDALWALAAFGLLIGIGAAPVLERVAGWTPLRLAGAASYAVTLVAMPVAAFAARQIPPQLGQTTTALVTGVAAFAVGFALWLGVDRWFGDDVLRRTAADGPGGALDRILAKVRAGRVVVGVPAAPPAREAFQVVAVASQAADFYAPPPRPAAGDLAVLSTRSGSAEDLAAEILETKRRLTEQSAAFFAPEPEPEPEPAPDAYEKPGFYRRSATPARPAGAGSAKMPAISSGGNGTSAARSAPLPAAPVRPVAAAAAVAQDARDARSSTERAEAGAAAARGTAPPAPELTLVAPVLAASPAADGAPQASNVAPQASDVASQAADVASQAADVAPQAADIWSRAAEAPSPSVARERRLYAVPARDAAVPPTSDAIPLPPGPADATAPVTVGPAPPAQAPVLPATPATAHAPVPDAAEPVSHVPVAHVPVAPVAVMPDRPASVPVEPAASPAVSVRQPAASAADPERIARHDGEYVPAASVPVALGDAAPPADDAVESDAPHERATAAMVAPAVSTDPEPVVSTLVATPDAIPTIRPFVDAVTPVAEVPPQSAGRASRANPATLDLGPRNAKPTLAQRLAHRLRNVEPSEPRTAALPDAPQPEPNAPAAIASDVERPAVAASDVPAPDVAASANPAAPATSDPRDATGRAASSVEVPAGASEPAETEPAAHVNALAAAVAALEHEEAALAGEPAASPPPPRHVAPRSAIRMRIGPARDVEPVPSEAGHG